jgi:hypothetical protein
VSASRVFHSLIGHFIVKSLTHVRVIMLLVQIFQDIECLHKRPKIRKQVVVDARHKTDLTSPFSLGIKVTAAILSSTHDRTPSGSIPEDTNVPLLVLVCCWGSAFSPGPYASPEG